MTLLNLEDRVVIVTGASSGIGRSTARELGSHRARLVLNGRRAEALASVARSVEQEGGRAVAVAGDLRDESLPEQLVGRAFQEYDRLDAAVHVAGVGFHAPVKESDDASWREMLEVNFLALARSCRLAAQAMDGRQGHILNVSSLAADHRNPYEAMYAATKSAVDVFTDVLRAELSGTEVAVCRVCPGGVVTNFSRHLSHEQRCTLAASLGFTPDQVPEPRDGVMPDEFLEEVHRRASGSFLHPDEVARTILTLLQSPPSEVPERVVVEPGSEGVPSSS